jgi:hypothetical protein
MPSASSCKAWRDEVLKRCIGDKLTHGDFAKALWNAIKDQSAPEWKRQKPDDADADGIPDVDDALPFSADTQSCP